MGQTTTACPVNIALYFYDTGFRANFRQDWPSRRTRALRAILMEAAWRYALISRGRGTWMSFDEQGDCRSPGCACFDAPVIPHRLFWMGQHFAWVAATRSSLWV